VSITGPEDKVWVAATGDSVRTTDAGVSIPQAENIKERRKRKETNFFILFLMDPVVE
jgi:hypothetical protein